MGKGGGKDCAREMNLSLAADDDRPVDYNSRKLNIVEVTDQAGLLACEEALSHPDVKVIGLDIETTGGMKPWEGSVRLIQLAVEHPEPKQFLLDMWKVSPAPILKFFEDDTIVKVTCNGRYEQLHMLYRYGVTINNLYDVSYVSREVTKAKARPAKEKHEAKVAQFKASMDEQIADAVAQVDTLTAAVKDAKKTVKDVRGAGGDVDAAKADVEDLEGRLLQAREVRDALKAQRRDGLAQLKEQAPKTRSVQSNFKQLMRRYVGKKISKEQQTSAWDDEHLSDHQKRYAAMDVAGLLDILPQLQRDVVSLGITAEAHAANQGVLESVTKSIEKYPTTHRDDVERLLRGFSAARTADELDTLRDLTGRLSIAHHQLKEVDEAYMSRWVELVTAEPASAPAPTADDDDMPF